MLLSKDVLKLIIGKYVCDINSPTFDIRFVCSLMNVSKLIQNCIPDQIKSAIKTINGTRNKQNQFIEDYVVALGYDPLKYHPCSICTTVMKFEKLSKHQRKCGLNMHHQCDICPKCKSIHPLFLLSPHLNGYEGCPLAKVSCRKCGIFRIESVLLHIHEHECNNRYRTSVSCLGVNKNGQSCKAKTKNSNRLCFHHSGTTQNTTKNTTKSI